MSEQVKKDVIVVAREGYSVLLEIDNRIFDIDCHKAINLSNIFSEDVLEKCSSLSTHLKDGNLILFKEDIKLSKDVTASAVIKPLREETAEHITSQYDQAERDVKRTNMELETRANITEETRKHIQEQVQIGKEKILQTDRKLLMKKVNRTTNEVVDPPKNSQRAMTAEELTLNVSMDVSPEEFARTQAISKNKLAATENADEKRAEKEIAFQENNEEQKNNEEQEII